MTTRGLRSMLRVTKKDGNVIGWEEGNTREKMIKNRRIIQKGD